MKKLILISILLLTGCASPLQLPSEKVVDTILPEYTKYVENDSKISDAAKKRRLDAVKSFTEAVNSGRN